MAVAGGSPVLVGPLVNAAAVIVSVRETSVTASTMGITRVGAAVVIVCLELEFMPVEVVASVDSTPQAYLFICGDRQITDKELQTRSLDSRRPCSSASAKSYRYRTFFMRKPGYF